MFSRGLNQMEALEDLVTFTGSADWGSSHVALRESKVVPGFGESEAR